MEVRMDGSPGLGVHAEVSCEETVADLAELRDPVDLHDFLRVSLDHVDEGTLHVIPARSVGVG
jgi:hypothetical protein